MFLPFFSQPGSRNRPEFFIFFVAFLGKLPYLLSRRFSCSSFAPPTIISKKIIKNSKFKLHSMRKWWNQIVVGDREVATYRSWWWWWWWWWIQWSTPLACRLTWETVPIRLSSGPRHPRLLKLHAIYNPPFYFHLTSWYVHTTLASGSFRIKSIGPCNVVHIDRCIMWVNWLQKGSRERPEITTQLCAVTIRNFTVVCMNRTLVELNLNKCSCTSLLTSSRSSFADDPN